MKKHKGEMWHLNRILKCLEKPKTQMEICKHSQISNHQLHPYLNKLIKLRFIEKVDSKDRNAMAIIWKATSKGREFNKIIAQYTSLGYRL